MKFTEFKTIKEDEDLFEINMSPSNLVKLANEIDAKVGIEFEMIVPNVKNDDYEPEFEPDYDQDEGISSVDNIRDFFHDGDYNSRRDVNNLIDSIMEDYYDSDFLSELKQEEWSDIALDHVSEYIQDTYKDELLDQARDILSDQDPKLTPDDASYQEELSAVYNKLYELRVEDVMANMGPEYDAIYEDWVDNVWPDISNDSDKVIEYLESQGITTMSDIQNNYDISWPHVREVERSDDFNREINDVADSFSSAIGRPVNSSTSYHGGRREAGHYVVEPDGSLDGDDDNDSGLEFISPPLTMKEMLSDIAKVKRWAERNGCYTNQSTGLHINISVPDFDVDKLDYIKLALLLGDKYVLEQFDRLGNTYAKSAMNKIIDRVRDRPEDAERLLDKMKQGLDQLATKVIHSGQTDKYTSINTKTGYIEFRSPGGDWLNDDTFEKIEPTLFRFVVALDAAMDPDKYRKEYLTKLRKLLAPKSENDTISYFAKYAAGELPKQALKSFVRQAQLERKIKKDPTGGQKYWWSVGRPGYFASVEVVASSKEEAIEKGKREYPDWANARDMTAKPLRPYQEPTPRTQTQQSNGPTLNGRPSNPLGGWVIVPENDRQTVVYRFNAAGYDDATIVRRQWAQEHPGRVWIVQRDDNRTLGQPSTGYRNTWSQTDIENRLGWGSQEADANYEVVDRSTMTTVFKFIANTPQEAERKYGQFLDLIGFPHDTENYGWREIALPGSTIDLQRQRADQSAQDAVARTQEGSVQWRILVGGEEVHRFWNRADQGEANTAARQWILDQIRRGLLSPAEGADVEVVPVQSGQQSNSPRNLDNRELEGWSVRLSNGREVTQIRGIGNNPGDANRIAADWLRQNGYGVSGEGFQVTPIWSSER